MPHITQLSPHVADLIAAGEVVERPASVAKELSENAVDAGAHTVTVEIQHGGMTLIRVTDDGCGIAPDEAETAFLRHATSKLRTEYDLAAISTLGFRGEALAAIAAVSRVTLLTRRRQDPAGLSLTLEGGIVTAREEAGCPPGTTLLVRDLFYNTPARLKFVKTDAAEGAACLAAIHRQALAHPEVSFKFLRDGRQELLTPGDGQLRSALYAVLGRDMALGFQAVESAGEDISIRGFVSLPVCCRGTRGYQFFFVNGRPIKSKTLTAALEQAYENQKMVGKFPGCTLHLNINPASVDVNVHPTKQEVKFGRERAVFTALYSAVLSALDSNSSRVQAELTASVPTPQETTSLPLHDFAAPKFERSGPAFQLPHAARPASPPPGRRDVQEFLPLAKMTKEPLSVPYQGTSLPPPHVDTPPEAEAEYPAPPEPPEEAPWRMVGELFRTYIVIEQGEHILLIDKHAAHERMNFDRMRREDYTPMSQTLINPVVFAANPEELQTLLEYQKELEKLGFVLEDFGSGTLVVRNAPEGVSSDDIPATLTELAEKLLYTGETDGQARRDALLRTVACKAAIKGGWKSTPQELEYIARRVMRGEVKTCPHGRPVVIELSRRQLEKQFKR